MSTMNPNGIAALREALIHVLNDACIDQLNPNGMSAWASDAEDAYDGGNGEHMEVHRLYTRSGRPEEIYLNPDWFDAE